jgi:hypothetical protein
MVEIIQAANQLSWPGALAVSTFCLAVSYAASVLIKALLD